MDIEGAVANLDAEAPVAESFDAARRQAEAAWDAALNSIQIGAQDPDERTVFYTAMYHSLTVPNLASDVDGRYRGTDLQVPIKCYPPLHGLLPVGHLPGDPPCSMFSSPNGQNSSSGISSACTKKAAPCRCGALAGNYTGCMIGYHAVPVIADAWAKGLRNFDADKALEAMVAEATADELAKPVWDSLGYLPLEKESESVQNVGVCL